MEVTHSPPELASFKQVAEHESITPESFFTGPPVLYRRENGTKALAVDSELRSCVPLARLFGWSDDGKKGEPLANGEGGTNGATGDDDAMEEVEVTADGVEVWITSDKFLLSRTDSSNSTTTLHIPYRLILLHALQERGRALYMQLLAEPDPVDDHDPSSTVSLTIFPAEAAAAAAAAPAPTDGASSAEDGTPAEALFHALSTCANLHPDPVSPESEDGEDGEGQEGEAAADAYFTSISQNGGLPPPMPGSGGWITADNVNEFFDEEGNWKGEGGEPMGRFMRDAAAEGAAGTVRRREADEGEESEEETKWQRIG